MSSATSDHLGAPLAARKEPPFNYRVPLMWFACKSHCPRPRYDPESHCSHPVHVPLTGANLPDRVLLKSVILDRDVLAGTYYRYSLLFDPSLDAPTSTVRYDLHFNQYGNPVLTRLLFDESARFNTENTWEIGKVIIDLRSSRVVRRMEHLFRDYELSFVQSACPSLLADMLLGAFFADTKASFRTVCETLQEYFYKFIAPGTPPSVQCGTRCANDHKADCHGFCICPSLHGIFYRHSDFGDTYKSLDTVEHGSPWDYDYTPPARQLRDMSPSKPKKSKPSTNSPTHAEAVAHVNACLGFIRFNFRDDVTTD